MTDLCDEKVRRRICEADEVIVICGEHTAASMRVGAELRIAQEEQKPCFLLWGRRESMCTKPVGSKRDEGMYSWTWKTLQSQASGVEPLDSEHPQAALTQQQTGIVPRSPAAARCEEADAPMHSASAVRPEAPRLGTAAGPASAGLARKIPSLPSDRVVWNATSPVSFAAAAPKLTKPGLRMGGGLNIPG